MIGIHLAYGASGYDPQCGKEVSLLPLPGGSHEAFASIRPSLQIDPGCPGFP
jgi:hypothetical protein